MTASMCTYYSIWALFATHLQRDLGLPPLMTGLPLAAANLVGFLGMAFWGFAGDRIGRRWSMIIPAFLGIFITPTYLLSADPTWILVGFLFQGLFAGAMYNQMPSFLTERFPTEIRATASAFCFHQAAIFGGGDIATLTVSDTGSGFVPKYESKRHGLGLVQRLIEQVSGTVVVKSDQGTVWDIRFPIATKMPSGA
jgi:MFS family permease